jgi:Flp pilus assembly protein TadG
MSILVGPGAKIRKLLGRFAKETGGAFAVVTAVLGIVLVALAGATVDFVQWQHMRNVAQSVADSASLAAATSSAEQDQEILDIAQGLLTSAAGGEGLAVTNATYNDESRLVQVRINGAYPTVFVSLVGVGELPVNVVSVAERASPGSLEVALVLDNTWSMSDDDATGVTKIAALKSAASKLITTLFAGSSGGISASLVPYANYVNVGTENRYQPWIFVPADYDTTSTKVCETKTTKQQCVKGTPKTCTRVVDGVSETYDCTPSVCTDVTVPPYQSCSGGGTTKYRWYGCVRSRTTGTNRLTDQNIGDLYQGFLGTSRGCLNPILPLTDDANLLRTNINAMIVNSGSYRPLTYIPTGVLWGINTLSPTMPFTEGAAYDPENKQPHKALVLMTDGDNTLRFQASDGQHVALSSNVKTGATQKTQTDTDTQALCTYAKSNGIEIFTVAFGELTTEANTLLSNCASSVENYFLAQNADELEDAFDQIAKSLSVIRLVR